MSSSQRAAPFTGRETDGAAMSRLAQASSRHFRTMLRYMAGGLHFEQAASLLALRSHTGLELLADDVNTVLAGCVFVTEREMAPLIVSSWKRSGRLLGRSDEDLRTEGLTIVQRHDAGDMPRLAAEALKRSPAMHDPSFRERLRVEDAALAAASPQQGRKRPRQTEEGAAVQCEEGLLQGSSGEAGDGLVASAGAAAGELGGTPAEVGRAFRHALGVLSSALAVRGGDQSGSCAPHSLASFRYARASSLLARCGVGRDIGVEPNARTYVLAVYGALAAGLLDEARGHVHALLSSGAAGPGGVGDLYLHMQPQFLSRLVSLGVLEDSPILLQAPEATDKWCFLTAAAQAARGDQQGSKHGAVLRAGPRVLAMGHNHRYAVTNDAHLRVMHAEIHALVKVEEERRRGLLPVAGTPQEVPAVRHAEAPAQLERQAGQHAEVPSVQDAKMSSGQHNPSSTTSLVPPPAAGASEQHSAASPTSYAAEQPSMTSTVLGSEVFIVELDGHGVGYEEAAPCAMCQTGLCQLGVSMVHYSSHAGLITQAVSHKPSLRCQTYAMALQRSYPKGATNPDGVCQQG